MNKILIAIIPAIISIIAIASFYTFGKSDDTVKIQMNETYVPDYMVEAPGFKLETMSRWSKYIVIGRVIDSSELMYKRDVMELPETGINVEVEKELTGTYKEKYINFRALVTTWVKGGDRVLVFLADKEPGTIWGDNYYVMGGVMGLYKIVNGKVYGQDLRSGLPFDDTIKAIEEARAHRIEEVTNLAKYIVIGKIKSITPTDPDSNTIYRFVTVDIEKELTGKYNDTQITLVTDKMYLEDIKYLKGSVGDRYLFFVIDDLESYNGNYHVGISDIYKITNGIAIGNEFQEGIPLDELIKKIEKFRNR